MSYWLPVICWMCLGKDVKCCPNHHCPHKTAPIQAGGEE